MSLPLVCPTANPNGFSYAFSLRPHKRWQQFRKRLNSCFSEVSFINTSRDPGFMMFISGINKSPKTISNQFMLTP